MQAIAVIPARLASTRLAQKLLLELDGKSVLERTYQQAKQAQHIKKVIVATDSERIYEHVKEFGGEVEMTSADHQSGTDRIAELAEKNPDWDLIINVQGDEPFIDPGDIDKAIEPFLHDPLMEMVSLYHEITDPIEVENPNNVKVVTDLNGNALYFSRSKLPHNTKSYKKHIGLYAYRRDTLLRITQMPRSELEKSEKLEQLRALENGIKIKMLKVNKPSIGIDTEQDYDLAKKLLLERS